MASNLSCIGFDVDDLDDLNALVRTVLPLSRSLGMRDGIDVRRWQDASGARLIIGVRDGELIDFLPSFAGRPGVQLAGCVRVNAEVISAAVMDEDGEQITAMAFELEQRRALDAAGPVSAIASVVAFGQDVTLHVDGAAFAESRQSLMDPEADLAEPMPERSGKPEVSWPIRYAPESFISHGVFGDPDDAEAYARLNGIVIAAQRRRNILTGLEFVVCRVRCLGFEVDVLLDGGAHPSTPAPDEVLAGTVFLVASIDSLTFGPSTEPSGSRLARWFGRR